ncbi:MAG TPA: J domain-containing protein [Azospirillaceae bacterium]|nr:J domain-containing protein [Azospirillaceae bacterium]
MQRSRASYRTVEEPPKAALRACDHPGCCEGGEYRAPKGRDRLNEYYWFCLEHVRAYNKAWDYYAGMSQDQIEAHIRNSTTWERPTWRMGEWRNRERYLRDRAMGDFVFGAEWTGEERAEAPPRRQPRTPEEEALAVLELEPPVDFARIKARYRELAKRHHPDANGGSKEAEETLKIINQAYNTLKAAYAG